MNLEKKHKLEGGKRLLFFVAKNTKGMVKCFIGKQKRKQ